MQLVLILALLLYLIHSCYSYSFFLSKDNIGVRLFFILTLKANVIREAFKKYLADFFR